MVVLVLGLTASARAVWSDDFDSYPAGTMILGEGAWAGWNQTGIDDAPVTNEKANSAPNSLEVGGATMVDLIPQFSDATSGIWIFDVMTFVPEDSVLKSSDIGFLSAHQGFQGAAATQWNGGLTLNMENGLVNNNAAVPIIRDQWILVKTIFDIDAKTYDLFYDGALARSGGFGPDQAIVAFDVWTPAGASPLYYDDFRMGPEGWIWDPDPEPPLPGDADDNGFIDDTDLAILLGNWESDPATISTWDLGNFTEATVGDTDVDDSDLAVLLGNWTRGSPGGAAVPEPATLWLLALGGLAMLRKRRN